MIVKLPACYDFSRYRNPDFPNLDPRPFIVITKATEATTWVDPTFVDYYQQMLTNGYHRGAYHFHRKALNPTEQARHFCNTIRPHVRPKDLLILDVEEGGETAAQLQTWFEYVMGEFPQNMLFIYSRANILNGIPMFLRSLLAPFVPHPLNAIAMTAAQREFFRRNVKTWTAGYPIYPDNYNTPPAGYIPDQTKWGEVLLWQYTDRAPVGGVEPCDANWVSPILVALLGDSVPPPPADTITHPFDGVTRVSGTRHGWKFELFQTDPAKCEYESVYCTPLETVSSVIARKRAQIGVNGGESDKVGGAIVGMDDYTVSNGAMVKARIKPVPSLQITVNKQIIIDHRNASGVRQALSGLRYIVQAGQTPAYLSGSEPQYTEGHARSIHGVTADGRHLVLQSQGVYPNQGLTLYQAAQVMIQYGAVTAFDSGGGGDVTCILNGQSLIVPENPGGAERALPNVLLIYTRGATMANGTAREARGNTTTVRDTPSRYGADTGGRIAPGSVIEFTATVPVQIQGTADKPGDTWLQLPDGNFINHVLAGVTYYTILTQPSTEPPPAPDSITIDITAHDVRTPGDKYQATGITLQKVG